MGQSPPPLDWPAQLRAQGRSMTWLASELDVSRTYLADVAAGRKHASPALAERIAMALDMPIPDRLGAVRAYAEERALDLSAADPRVAYLLGRLTRQDGAYLRALLREARRLGRIEGQRLPSPYTPERMADWQRLHGDEIG